MIQSQDTNRNNTQNNMPLEEMLELVQPRLINERLPAKIQHMVPNAVVELIETIITETEPRFNTFLWNGRFNLVPEGFRLPM